MRRTLRIALAVLALLGAPPPAGSKALGGAEILKRAEDVRNPKLSYAVDLSIRTVTGKPNVPEQTSTYTLIASGQDNSIILMRTPDAYYGGLMLITEGRYWMLLPRATKPRELAPIQVLAGDVSAGDIARANLLRGYTVALDGEEEVDGEPCYRLELTGTAERENYPRIVYWVAKKKFLPWKLELYGRTTRLLKTVRFADYREGKIGLRPMKLDVQAADRLDYSSTVTFTNLRKIAPKEVAFTPDGMMPVRTAVLAGREPSGRTDLPVEQLLPNAAAGR